MWTSVTVSHSLHLSLLPHLLILPSFGHGAVLLGLLEEDLLHLAVLQIVQLPNCILGSCDQVHDDRQRALAAQEAMLQDREDR